MESYYREGVSAQRLIMMETMPTDVWSWDYTERRLESSEILVIEYVVNEQVMICTNHVNVVPPSMWSPQHNQVFSGPPGGERFPVPFGVR